MTKPYASSLPKKFPFPPWLSIFLLALAVRLAYLAIIRGSPFFDSPVVDAMTYDEIAQRIARGVLTDREVFWQPPLYPYFLGIVYALAGHNLAIARVVQAFLGALTCSLAAEVGYRHFGPAVRWYTGILLSVHGPLVFFGGELLVPVISIPLNLAALLCLSPPERHPLSLRRVMLAGLLLGISANARPTILLFVVFQTASLAVLSTRHALSDRLLKASCLLFFSTLLILPATLYNHQAGGEWVLISSNGGVNFYLGNNDRYEESIRVRPGIAWKQLMHEPDEHGMDTPGKESRYWYSKGWHFISEHPIQALGLTLKKTWRLTEAYESPRNLDYYFFAEKFARPLLFLPTWGLLFPLAVIGLWRTWRQRGQSVLYLFLFANTATIVLFFVTARYRLDLVPILAIYSGVAVDIWVHALKSKEYQKLLCSLATFCALFFLGRIDPWGTSRTDESEGYNLVGKAHSNAGRHAEAIRAFERSISLNPENIDAQFNLGRELQLAQNCSAAIPYYDTALQHYPNDRDTLNNLGVCLTSTGRPQDGLELLEKAARLSPESSPQYFNLAQAYLGLWRLEDAKNALAKALERPPGSDSIRTLSKEVDRLLDLEGKALEICTQLAVQAPPPDSRQAAPIHTRSRPPSTAVSTNNRAHQLLAKGDIPGALTLLLELVVSVPDYAIAWSNLGQGYYLASRYSTARQAFETAIILDPDLWKARLGLALTLANGLHDAAGARALLEELMRGQDPEAGAAAESLLVTMEHEQPGP